MELNSWMNPKTYLHAVEMNNIESFKTFSALLMSYFRTFSQHFSTCVDIHDFYGPEKWLHQISGLFSFSAFVGRNPESTDWLTTQQATQTGGRQRRNP